MDPLNPDIGTEDYKQEETTETTKKPSGEVITKVTKSTTWQTADIALILVFLLCLVLLGMAIFIDSMREGLDGALPYLLGLFALAIGGVEGYRAVTGKNKKTETKVVTTT